MWIYTRDLDASSAFYCDTLGLECIRDEGPARIFRTAPDACIGVCPEFEDRVVEPGGMMISIVTGEVESWCRRLIEAGATVRGAPHRLPQFGIYTFFAEDPNGYVVEFAQFGDPV